MKRSLFIMKRSFFIALVKQKYNTEGKSCYFANAFYHTPDGDTVAQGYVVDNKYFIDEQTQKISETSAFFMINNIEADDNM